ncbi:MAG: DNA repair protein RadC [Pseudomonadota bacterium]
MVMRDIPHSERPRERLLRLGPEALLDAELVALVLGTGPRGPGVLGTAQALLTRFGDLRRMASAGTAELLSIPGMGIAQACRMKAALALAGRLMERPFARGEPLSGPQDVYQRLGPRLALNDREVFMALALDVKHRIIAEQQLADGGACSVEVLPRDVFSRLLREEASSVVFVHNHPSGDPAPSAADEELTRRLTAAGALVGIRVLDHVIIAQHGFHTFAEDRTVRRASWARP